MNDVERRAILVKEIEELNQIADTIINFKTQVNGAEFNRFGNASDAFFEAKAFYNDEYRQTDPVPTLTELRATRSAYMDALKGIGVTPIKDLRGGTPLMRLIQQNSTDNTLPMITKLINIEVDVNAQSQDGDTALSVAVTGNEPQIIHMLLKAHAKLDAANSMSLIDLAVRNGNLEILELLLRETLNQVGTLNLDNAIIAAAMTKNTEVVTLLLEYNANINIQSPTGKTPLHIAAQNGDLAMVNLLIAKNAKLDTADDKGNTPLHYAAMAGDDARQNAPKTTTRSLHLNLFSNMDTPRRNDDDEPTAQEVARQTGASREKQENYLNIARNLVDNGASREMKNHNNKTPLELTIGCQRNDMADIIMTDPDVVPSNNNNRRF